MSDQMGFVFNQNTPNNYNSDPFQPIGYPAFPQPPVGFNPGMPSDYGGHVAPPYPPPFPHSNPDMPQGHVVPYNQPYPSYPNNDGCFNNGGYGQEMKGGGGYPPPQHFNQYDGPPGHIMTSAEVESDIHGRHGGSGGGIPGGKLGVIGGAAAAGVGTGLVMQLLPKKMKKNKLIKYGLPLAGAGAAGYTLNKMNQNGKH